MMAAVNRDTAGVEAGSKGGPMGVWTSLVRDEAGMTLGIVIIMIVVIGVMGAGLLTFVNTDLKAVIDANQGQRAFEMADAGVEAARKQIRDKDPLPNHYGGADGATGDIQWAASQGGETLDMTTVDGNTDSVNVRIEADTSSPGFYEVISTGAAGEARRRIEAIFYHTTNFGGGGIPAWYTEGGIRLKKDALANGISMFAGGDVVLRKDSSAGSGPDILANWYNPPYNTTARVDAAGNPYTRAGLAAEGQVLCSATEGGAATTCGAADTAGILYYDSDTPTKFVDAPTTQPQPADEITYPFSRQVNTEGLLQKAQSGESNLYLTSSKSNIPESEEKRVIFVDAGGGTVDFDKNGTFRGILVVRCGDVNMDKEGVFEGIVMAIKGSGPGCEKTGKVNFKKALTFNGYVYAESTDPKAIDADKGPVVGPLPDGYDDFTKLAFISSVETVSWRELYE